MKTETITLEQLVLDVLNNKYTKEELGTIEQILETAKQHLPCTICITHYNERSKSFSITPVNSHSPTNNPTSIN